MEATKQEPITKQWLYGRGWTIQDAANHFGVHRVHLCLVLSGKRKSKKLLRQIALLPYKKLQLRKIKK